MEGMREGEGEGEKEERERGVPLTTDTDTTHQCDTHSVMIFRAGFSTIFIILRSTIIITFVG